MYIFKCTAFFDHPYQCKYGADSPYKGLLLCCHSCEKYETCKYKCENMVHRCGKVEIERMEETPQPQKKRSAKVAVIQYDRQGNELASYDSVTEASAATGVMISCISNALVGISKSAGGYLWRRKE
jgi:hypothetical protein